MHHSNRPPVTGNGFESHHIRGDEDASLIVLRTPRARAMIPSILDKAEFSIWAEREPGDTAEKRIKTFYEFFGKPEFLPADNISNAQLPAELERLCEMMKKHGVILKSFTEIPPRVLYRFITKELFKMLTTGKLSPNPLKLVYEEFHGSDEYQIRKMTSDFVRLLFDCIMGPYRIKPLKHSLKNYKEIKCLLWTYQDFELDFMEMDEIAIDGDSASIFFEIGYFGFTGEGLVHHFKGKGNCELVKRGGSWNITCVSLPDRVN